MKLMKVLAFSARVYLRMFGFIVSYGHLQVTETVLTNFPWYLCADKLQSV
jgi:hypothetical protein